MQILPLPPVLRTLGRTSLHVFPIAYGCWRFAGSSLDQARAKVETAMEVGITLFDHADIYGGDGAAEDLFGRVLRESPHLRNSMVLATKCGIVAGMPYDSSADHIRKACEASLRRLHVDVIDLYQIHRPDWLGDPQEIAAALYDLRRQGKIREVGVSNYSASQTTALQAFLPFPIATHQPEISVWCLDTFRDGVLDQCAQHSITPLAWSPLARGLIGISPDAARREEGGERLSALLECLDRIATEQSVSRTAVALAFLLVHPSGIVPILGTQQESRIRDAMSAFQVKLTRADWYAIVAASQGYPLP